MRIRTAFAAFALAATALVTAAGAASASDGRDINVNVGNGSINNIVCNAENFSALNAFNVQPQTAVACLNAED